MRKNCLLLIALALTLVGCGQSGPSHKQIQNVFASELPPFLKITTIESEFVPTTQDSGVVRIRTKLELTEDLFTQVPRESTTKTAPLSTELANVLKDAETQGVLIPTDSEKQFKIASESYLLKSSAAQIPVLKIADKQGTPFSFSGTSDALLEFKEWKLSPFVGTAPQITGLPRNSFPANALMIGDPKISNAEDDAQKAFDNLVKAQQAHINNVASAIKTNKEARIHAQKELIFKALTACKNAAGTAREGSKQWAVETQLVFDENSNSITGWIFWPEIKSRKTWEGSIQMDKDGMPFVRLKELKFIEQPTLWERLLGIQYDLHPKEQGLSGSWECGYHTGTISLLPATPRATPQTAPSPASAPASNANGGLKSPSSEFAVVVGKSVTVANANGQNVGIIIDDIENIDATISASWNPDSNAVAVIEQYGRAADVFITTQNGSAWVTNMVASSTVISDFYKSAGLTDKVSREKKTFGGWLGSSKFLIKAVGTTRAGKDVSFSYSVTLGGGKPVCKME